MQKIIQHVLYPLDCIRSGNRDILRYQREFAASQYLTQPELQERSFSRMKMMLEYAYEHIDFYRRRFDEFGVRPTQIQSPNDLAVLPILEKRDIQDCLPSLISNQYSPANLILDRTGGSTGTPIEYYYTPQRHRSRKAATWRHNSFANWNIGDKAAVLWGAASDLPKPGLKQRLRNQLIDRTLFFNTAGFQPDDFLRFNDQLKRFRPKAILAYANSLGLFAQYLKDQGVAPYSPQVIVTSAEMLTTENRQLIEEVFSAPVFNRYGSREFSVIASAKNTPC